MIILLSKRHLWTMVLCCCSVIGLTAVLWAGSILPQTVSVFSPARQGSITWIVDAGHGGEDGGAVSPNGVAESRINLEIALRLHDLLRFTGQQTLMTRTDDNAIHTQGDTIRARKASDIRNRVSIVNDIENAVLLSIHQNSLPSSPATHGAQVFWNRQEGGESIAQMLQDSLNRTINIGNEKHAKRISDSIYLMKHVTAPAALIECGFLSNSSESTFLQQASYQIKLAAAITAGCLRALAGEELP